MAYRQWKKRNVAPLSPAEESEAIAQLNVKLGELPALMRGTDCLNTWGWGMDDVVLLPTLRRLTMIKGIDFPQRVRDYVYVETPMADFTPHAL